MRWPALARWRRPLARTARWLLPLAAVAALDGFWVEPRLLLWRDEAFLALPTGPYRIVHLSDLHVARETAIERRLLRRVATEAPDLIVVSGDMVADTHDLDALVAHTRAAAQVLGELRRLAPVVAVQGHSEYWGPVVAELGSSGLEWLSNEGKVFGRDGGFLLLGLNQQVGTDRPWADREPPFETVEIAGEPAWGRTRRGVFNSYLHFDPPAGGLTDAGGPLAWRDQELTVEMRLGSNRSEGGIAVLSRYPLGEDRLFQIVRPGLDSDRPTRFTIIPHGTAPNGQGDTGVDPEPGRWYSLRVRATVAAELTRLELRAWPSGTPEPAAWQAWAEDRSAARLQAGTVGLWAREGTVAFRNLRVTDGRGKVLLDEPMAGPASPASRGFRQGPRASRLELALARSPAVPPGTPRIVVSHVPDVALEAAATGIDAVLAGHTHGGQVRLPGGLAILTRSELGPHYDRGVFDFASPAAAGWTRLVVNSGVGTSKLAVRFSCPPSYFVVEVGRR